MSTCSLAGLSPTAEAWRPNCSTVSGTLPSVANLGPATGFPEWAFASISSCLERRSGSRRKRSPRKAFLSSSRTGAPLSRSSRRRSRRANWSEKCEGQRPPGASRPAYGNDRKLSARGGERLSSPQSEVPPDTFRHRGERGALGTPRTLLGRFTWSASS